MAQQKINTQFNNNKMRPINYKKAYTQKLDQRF